MAAEEAKPLDDASAIKIIADRMEGKTAPTTQADDQTDEANPPATEAAPEAETDQELTESEGESDEQPETAPTLPESIEDLAAAYGVPVDKLADTLKVKVKVDGQDQVVNLGEAVKGYQLESDYRKKTGKLAEERRQLDEISQQAVRSLDARLTVAEQLESFLAQEIGLQADPAELDRLFETDRDAYDRRKREIERKTERLKAAMQARQQLTAQQQQEALEFKARKRDEQISSFLSKATELNDVTRQAEFEKKTVAVLKEVGFSPEEIARYLDPKNPWDHRQMLLIRKAIKADEIESVQKKVAPILKNVPKMVRPGGASSPGERPDKHSDTRSRFLKNPTTQNALEYMKTKIR